VPILFQEVDGVPGSGGEAEVAAGEGENVESRGAGFDLVKAVMDGDRDGS
jgi:hypothetical protein